jgi:hypothetical protein
MAFGHNFLVDGIHLRQGHGVTVAKSVDHAAAPLLRLHVPQLLLRWATSCLCLSFC